MHAGAINITLPYLATMPVKPHQQACFRRCTFPRLSYRLHRRCNTLSTPYVGSARNNPQWSNSSDALVSQVLQAIEDTGTHGRCARTTFNPTHVSHRFWRQGFPSRARGNRRQTVHTGKRWQAARATAAKPLDFWQLRGVIHIHTRQLTSYANVLAHCQGWITPPQLRAAVFEVAWARSSTEQPACIRLCCALMWL